MTKTIIRNIRLLDPSQNLDQVSDLYLAAGKIAGIQNAPSDFNADKIIDGTQKIICPGIIDSQINLRNLTQLETELVAAKNLGINHAILAPSIEPIIDSPEKIEWLNYVVTNNNLALKVHPLAALTKNLANQQLSPLAGLQAAGAIAASLAKQALPSPKLLRYAMQYAASHDLLLVLYPYEASLSEHGIAHDGLANTMLGLAGLPASAEAIGLATAIILAEETGARLHINGISSAYSVDILRQAKARGCNITAGIAMHQLFLTEMNLELNDGNYHLLPPLRSIADRDALLAGLKDRTIDLIYSDHTPLNYEQKQAPFAQTIPGISSLDSFIPLGLNLVQQEIISLELLLNCLCLRPAEIFKLPRRQIAVGETADLSILEFKSWKMSSAQMQSAAANNPFINWEFAGRGQMTSI